MTTKEITEIIECLDDNLSRMEDVLKGEMGDLCTNTRTLAISLNTDIHSFASSQAIEFAEWIVANDYRATVSCKNWAKWNPASSTWIYRTTAKLLTEFIEWKKQQEGNGE